MSVCVSPANNFLLFYRVVEFYKIWYGGSAIQGDLDAIIFFQ
jgi:hypothetical protein